jgi:hypothetical protein
VVDLFFKTMASRSSGRNLQGAPVLRYRASCNGNTHPLHFARKSVIGERFFLVLFGDEIAEKLWLVLMRSLFRLK